jgi:hypothetical protein
MKFARWVFLLAGIYGMIVVLPHFFLEKQVNRDYPPAITWQVAFLIISRDPVRYRPIMLAGIVEKASFTIATIALYLAERLPAPMLVFGLIDLVLGALFLVAWWKTASDS